ncbi:Alpha-1 3(6)-mannosylglycoprotein beta-1 6-N-acetyl-glucosaminyltransferase [Fasciola gigantica]|uniref:alpha-1,6-mannosyl-glycoprotein 6-beta-N-acetylglucosaminyltransferase n=1 Tax=Fasciola gigantica TaxID=46835 RepID=A0A504YCN0_FASGI|nr:Alpha-1 3(6)-mannosylglycoprotein beta-1 6-N-acetyl-glucosaminyltransferase [Fasciola gigantica]
MAKIRTSITELISLVVTDDEHTNSNQFMRERIKRMWSQWMDGLDRYKRWIDQSSTQLTVKPNLYNRIKLHIHIHLGLLTLGPSVGIEEEINKGGPLGELVQWTDLITALYLLGHKITVSKNIARTVHLLLDGKFHDTPCSGISERPHLVYTDIRGFRQLEKSKASFPKCKFRVLDSFGTENKYNLKVPVQFSGLKLNLQQFQTFFQCNCLFDNSVGILRDSWQCGGRV